MRHVKKKEAQCESSSISMIKVDCQAHSSNQLSNLNLTSSETTALALCTAAQDHRSDQVAKRSTRRIIPQSKQQSESPRVIPPETERVKRSGRISNSPDRLDVIEL